MYKPVAWYEAKVIHGFSALLPALILPAFAAIGILAWKPYGHVPSMEDVLGLFIMALPLIGGLASAHLMSIEREENFDALRRSYPEPSWRLPLVRLAGTALLLALSVTACLLLLRVVGCYYTVDEVVRPALPATLFMMALAQLVNNLTGSQPVGVVAAVGYWVMEMQTGGEYTGILYLFRAAGGISDYTPEQNGAALLTAAFALLALNVGWSIRRRSMGG